MLPKTSINSNIVLEQTFSEYTDEDNLKKSSSSQKLIKEIKYLKRGLHRLIKQTNSNQNKLQTIQNFIENESLPRSRQNLKTDSENSRFGRFINYDDEYNLQQSSRIQLKRPQRVFKKFSMQTNDQRPKSLSIRKKIVRQKDDYSISKNGEAKRLLQKKSIKTRDSQTNSNNYKQHDLSIKQNQKISQLASNKYKNRFLTKFQDNDEKLNWVRENTIGINTNFISPLGLQLQAVYVDHTATNKPFKTVEAMLEYAKLFGANPHTQYSEFGKYSTELVHYSELSLLNSMSADPKQYIAIPAGSGSTGAIQHAIQIFQTQNVFPNKQNLAIFITPYEHHSNILPWVQFYENKIQVLSHDEDCTLMLPLIKQQIIKHPAKDILISISAASNVTSKLTDLKQFNSIVADLRKNQLKNRIIFALDCAAFCCHHQLNLKQLNQVDMVYMSPHKNLGGSESCGVLILKKYIVGKIPSFPGGGTVRFVKGYHKNDIVYDNSTFARQVAGTPSFFGFYRAALSFQLLKESIGYKFIHDQETKNTRYFYNLVKQLNTKLNKEQINTEIRLYGQKNLEKRANVITLNIIFSNNQILFYNFISLVLTDIFGIQVRSGCFCAGPYGIELLKLNKNQINKIQKQVESGYTINKPGYVRFDLTFYLKDYQINYIGKALYYICKYHHNLRSLYNIQQSGVVTQKKNLNNNRKYFNQLKLVNNAYQISSQHKIQNVSKLVNRRKTLQSQLKIAKSICKHPEDYLA